MAWNDRNGGNGSQAKRPQEYHEVPDGTYACWLNSYRVGDQPNRKGEEVKRVSLAFKVCEDAEAGQFIWDNFFVEREGEPVEKAVKALELKIGRMVEGYYHDPEATFESELQQVVDMCRDRRFYVRKTTKDGYQRVYVQCECPKLGEQA